MSKKFTYTMSMLVLVLVLVISTGCNALTTKANSSSDLENPQDNSTGADTGSATTSNKQLLPIITGNKPDLQLDESADGTTQELKVDGSLSIKLESNPSTGYSWFATSSNPEVIAQKEDPVFETSPSITSADVVGAAGTDTFYFAAVSAGTATLTFEYKRGWETDVAAEKTLTINVEVK